MLKNKIHRLAETGGGLIPQKLQDGFVALTKPLIAILARWDINPNTVTIVGVLLTACAAVALILGHIRWGGFLILLGGLCDMIDGPLARNTNKATSFGAFFDSTFDRYAEFIMFFGIAVHFLITNQYWSVVAVLLALCGSLMVSYTRARAEGLGFKASIGLMQRPERILIIGLAALIHPSALKLATWLVALVANYTAVQRIVCVYKQDLK